MVVSRTPELLSPAGDPEAMRAAVANGADAVYFGLGDFNARHRATNFSLEELPETMQFLHERGVRGYVTFNTLVFSYELPRAVEYLSAVIEAGADAVIVQDLGIVRLVRRMAPGFAIHGSTQMTLTEPRGIEFVRGLGVERVILARELSLGEIEKIAGATSVPVEVFVHGALCVAYSGQCLTSEAIGGRSANRGQCAQACRQPYELIVDGDPRELGDKAYLLSPQDLAAHDLVADLARLGVASLKIEGRLKSAHYVAATTQTYRAALDAALTNRPFALSAQQALDLRQSFSRGFTHGFLGGVNHQKLVQGSFPKNRGVRVGTVTEVTHRGVVIDLDPAIRGASTEGGLAHLKPGDGIVFDQGHPEQDEQGGRIYTVTPRVSQRDPSRIDAAELTFGDGAVNLRAVDRGATVWKTDDPALRRRLEQSWSGDARAKRIPLQIEIRGAPGERLSVTFREPDGHVAHVESDGPLSAAVKHPLTPALAREQLGRLGGTPYELECVTFSGPDGPADQLPVMAPKSVLNDLRRRGVARLAELRATALRGTKVEARALELLRAEIRFPRDKRLSDSALPESAGTAALTVLCRTIGQLEALLDPDWSDEIAAPSLVYCDFEDVRRSKEAVASCRAAGMPVAVATPRIIKPAETGLLLQVANCHPDGVLVRNLAALSYYRENFPELALYGDYALNVTNELTADLLARSGLTRLVPGYDLNLGQLEALLDAIDPSLFEIVLHQHIPMFHMEHCVFSHVLSNGKDFHDCGRPCDRHQVELRDHVGEKHPLVADVGCRNTVFAARAQSAAPYVPRLLQRGVRTFRIELLRENGDETRSLVETYARVLSGRAQGPRVWRALQVLNQVGLTRGTLEFE
jgi:U32 family peptidase